MLRARIIGTGHYLPEKIYTNFDLEKLVDTTDEWIRQRTGIEQRHVAEPGSGVSGLMVPAARQAMEMAGVTAGEIDLILCCTLTADYIFPATGPLIQNALGAKRAAAVDLNAACSGFLYGLATADAFIRAGVYKTILVTGGEVVTNRIDWKARDSSVLFGDGAGAVVIRAHEGDQGILSTYLRADGGEVDMLWLPEGGSKEPYTNETFNEGRMTVRMKGPELFKRAVVEFGDAIKRACEDSGVAAEAIALFVPHQANERILIAAAQRAGIPPEKTIININKVGNTVAGSIPIALDQANRAGRIKEGDFVLLAGFGAGLTWGSAMVRW